MKKINHFICYLLISIFTFFLFSCDFTIQYVENQTDETIMVMFFGGGGTLVSGEEVQRVNDATELIPPIYERAGYTFSGFDIDLSTITTNTKVYAKWDIINYNINYDLDGGVNNPLNPLTYTIEDEVILLNPSKKGYTFTGWDNEGKIETGSIGNKSFTANFTPNIYSISYDLNDGTISSSNPIQYTIETATFTLNNPTKAGYTFVGWTGTGLVEETMNVSINQGSIGNKTFTANFTPNTYTITYDVNGGDELDNNTQDVIYNSSYKLIVPTKAGYTFMGWYNGNNIIESGTWKYTSSIELKAKWEATKYSITYNLNGGSASIDNPIEYTIETVTFTLNNPTKAGYTFVGWTGSDLVEETMNVSINQGTIGNKTFTANFTPNIYNISYDLNDGILLNDNPIEYTIESSTFTLNNPTKDGYTFIGWTGTGLTEETIDVTIDQGSIENKSFTANFTPNTYTITYDVNGGDELYNNTQDVNYNSSFELKVPTREGYTFMGWYNGDTQVNSGTWKYTSNIELKAEWIKEGEVFVENGITYLYYGKYPQTHVSNEALISQLNQLTITNSNGYYEYDGEEYTKLSANPYTSFYTFADGTTVVSGTTYWFKVEPIKWRVLKTDNNEYMLLSEYLIDAKQYHNSTSTRTINGKTIYANNYEYSDIRQWLNNDFYNIAFSSLEQQSIKTTLVDNSVSSTGYSEFNPYACKNTNDKLFLLSYKEAKNTSTTTRKAKVTDYAVARGAYYDTSSSYLRNGYWWLRSPGGEYSGYGFSGAHFVNYDGIVDVISGGYLYYDYYVNYVNITCYSVCPAFVLSLAPQE